MKATTNKRYSTTRLITKEKPKSINSAEDKYDTILFMPENEERNGEGGLRTKGCFKKTYEDKPLISIITVVYNGEAFLEDAIRSVINQTYDNVEYIIIDGGSNDRTLNIIRKYEEYIDYWISEQDESMYDAINKGICLAIGDIVGIVNADDYLYRGSLKKIQLGFSDEIMFVYANLDIVDKENNFISKSYSLGVDKIRFKLFRHMPFLHPTLFLKRRVFEEIGLYNCNYRLSADHDFTLRLVENNVKGKKLEFSSGAFRVGGRGGGIDSYKESHRLLINHNVNIFLVYTNSVILLIKYIIRRLFLRAPF